MQLNARDTASMFLMLGYPILLIRPDPSKLPLHKGWPDRELTDLDIDGAFAEQPKLGVGIKLGGPAGFVDIEGDGPTAETDWGILTSGVQVPITAGWTSERGVHRLFHLPIDYRKGIGEGIIKVGDLEIRLGAADRYTHYSILPPAGGRVWTSQ